MEAGVGISAEVCAGAIVETLWTQIAHWWTAGMVTALMGFLLREHKVWIRLKDRMNTLWSDRCKDKGERFIPLENGK